MVDEKALICCSVILSMGMKLLRYWKIVSGHKEKTPDEVKSVMLGDWLRNNYISIGWGAEYPQHRVFRDEMVIGARAFFSTYLFLKYAHMGDLGYSIRDIL